MMLCNIEFYNTPDGTIMMKPHERTACELTSSNRQVVQEMLVLIKDLWPEAFERAAELNARHERNRLFFEFNIISRFIRCNFGEYDQFHYDIDQQGTFKFEEVRCPLRGICIHEGVICKPVLNTKLTDREQEVIQLIGDGLQAAQIATELNISVTTVNRHRENIKARLNLRTVGQIIKYYHEYIKK